VPTVAGPLYQIDTRLRPMGGNGPLVVSLDSFQRYQQDEAWTWEHMALTRARAVYGSPDARAAVTDVIASVLSGRRAVHDVVGDAREMRAKMAAHKPPAGPLDAKLLPGGLVDLEFATHVVQLTRKAGFSPSLGTAIERLVELELMPASMRAAHDVLTRLLVTLRLVAPDAAPPGDATQAVIARALGVADWTGVITALKDACADVRVFWKELTA
jgi:glutamate-ammonia-ligase adenylyltransferase